MVRVTDDGRESGRSGAAEPWRLVLARQDNDPRSESRNRTTAEGRGSRGASHPAQPLQVAATLKQTLVLVAPVV